MQDIMEFAFRHWPFFIALGIIVLLILINEMLGRKNSAMRIAPKAAVNLINHESAVLLDVRNTEDFEKMHIIDAVLTSADQFANQKLERYKEKPVIIVCLRGIQSAVCAQKAKQHGFKHVYVLAGGMQAWVEAELPIIKSKAK